MFVCGGEHVELCFSVVENILNCVCLNHSLPLVWHAVHSVVGSPVVVVVDVVE